MKSAFALVTDPYERKARLYPALLVLLPFVAVAVALYPSSLSGLRSVATTLAAGGGLFLLAQIARTSGKRQEDSLFAAWGGKPSITILRHRDSRLSPVTKSRYHKKLAILVGGTSAPTADEEASDPGAADDTYAAWSDFLRVNARDAPNKYPLVFQENVGYGYCRNVWGMRPVGLASTGFLTAFAGGVCFYKWRSGAEAPELLAGAAALCLAMFLLWAFRFTRAWVKVPAVAYAERLVETVETYTAEAPPPRAAARKTK
jgi:hypothetical protein